MQSVGGQTPVRGRHALYSKGKVWGIRPTSGEGVHYIVKAEWGGPDPRQMKECTILLLLLLKEVGNARLGESD